MNPITLHGIANCDTVKKARAWLDEVGVAYQFHDFKKLGVGTDLLEAAGAQLGWQALVNQRGTTWRKLDAQAQSQLVDLPSAVVCLQANTSLIKRPLVRWADGRFTVGFSPESFSKGKYGP